MYLRTVSDTKKNKQRMSKSWDVRKWKFTQKQSHLNQIFQVNTTKNINILDTPQILSKYSIPHKIQLMWNKYGHSKLWLFNNYIMFSTFRSALAPPTNVQFCPHMWTDWQVLFPHNVNVVHNVTVVYADIRTYGGGSAHWWVGRVLA